MLKETKKFHNLIELYCAGGRFGNDRGGGRFNDRRNTNQTVDRGNRIGSNNNNYMRDYVEPWAHNNQMGGNNTFSSNSGGMNMPSLMGSLTGQNGNSVNGGNKMENDGKQTTQVTIPKEVRHCSLTNLLKI